MDGLRRHLYVRAKPTTERAADTSYIDCHLNGKNKADFLVQMDNEDNIKVIKNIE